MNKSIVRGISQIAIAVKSLDDISKWLHLFSNDEKQRYTSKKEGVNALVVKTKFCNIEFLEPINDQSTISSFLKKNPEGGLHHICFYVDNLNEALLSLKKNGVRNITREKIYGIIDNSPVAFLNPKDLSGVLVEFEEITSKK